MYEFASDKLYKTEFELHVTHGL